MESYGNAPLFSNKRRVDPPSFREVILSLAVTSHFTDSQVSVSISDMCTRMKVELDTRLWLARYK